MSTPLQLEPEVETQNQNQNQNQSQSQTQSQIQIQPQETEDLSIVFNFLSLVNSKINEIRKSEEKKYSLLSTIFNCFHENNAISLPKKIIYEYILQDIQNYRNKMIVSFVENGTNTMETITEKNYNKKTHTTIAKNKCLLHYTDDQRVERISINISFIKMHENLLIKNLFGKSGVVNAQPRPRINYASSGKINKSRARVEKDSNIEIIESENDDTFDTPSYRRGTRSSIKYERIMPDDNPYNYLNKSDMNYLNRKRRYSSDQQNIKREGNQEELYRYIDDFNDEIENKNMSNERSDSIIIDLDENKEENKEEKKSERDVLSLLEEGKIFLSLFKDKEVFDEFQSQINDLNEADTYNKHLLMKYQKDDIINSYLSIINNYHVQFQRSLKSLIEYKNILDGRNDNKLLSKITIMNKIMYGKEKCSLIIDKILVKLKQMVLEYNLVQKILNNLDKNKLDFFKRFKGSVISNKQEKEKENYINSLKAKLQEELTKAFKSRSQEAPIN